MRGWVCSRPARMILALGIPAILVAGAQAQERRSVAYSEALRCAQEAKTTADTRNCWIAQIDNARKALDAEYGSFLKAVPADKRAKVAQAQKAWRSYYGAQCSLYLEVFKGTMWHPVSDQCVLEKVEQRTREVSEMRRVYTLP